MDYCDRIAISLVITSSTIFLHSTVSSYLSCVLIWSYRLHHLGFVSHLFPLVPFLILGLGLSSVAVASYGLCCASASRNWKHLTFFGVALAVLFVADMLVACAANELRVAISMQTFSQVDVAGFASRYPTDASAQRSWDVLQSSYVCCGGSSRLSGFDLWKDILDQSVPDSCCLHPSPGCGHQIFLGVSRQNIVRRVHSRGCMVVIEDAIVRDVAPLLQAYFLTSLVAAVVVLVSVALALAAAVELRRYDEVYAGADCNQGEEGSEEKNGKSYCRGKEVDLLSPLSSGSTGTL